MPEDEGSIKNRHREEIAKWKEIVAQYQKPNLCRASWQIVNTLGAYVLPERIKVCQTY